MRNSSIVERRRRQPEPRQRSGLDLLRSTSRSQARARRRSQPAAVLEVLIVLLATLIGFGVGSLTTYQLMQDEPGVVIRIHAGHVTDKLDRFMRAQRQRLDELRGAS